MNNKEQEQLANVQSIVSRLTSKLITEGESAPLIVAAALAATAMGIYKTALSPDDYDHMVKMIAENRDLVKPFGQAEPTQTGPLH